MALKLWQTYDGRKNDCTFGICSGSWNNAYSHGAESSLFRTQGTADVYADNLSPPPSVLRCKLMMAITVKIKRMIVVTFRASNMI